MKTYHLKSPYTVLSDLEASNAIEGEFGNFNFRAHLFQKKESENLFVMFNGAMVLGKEYPTYHRWVWQEDFPGSVLYIADPLLDIFSDLTLAWYAGTYLQSAEGLIVNLVNSVVQSIGAKQVISWGSSGGGFASIRLAIVRPSTLAVAVNPQTSILKYHERHVKQYFEAAFPNDPIEKLELDERFHCLQPLADHSRVLYVQNIQDKFHFKNHLTPFAQFHGVSLDMTSEVKNSVRLFLYDSPEGHGPETRDMVPSLLQQILVDKETN